MPHVLGQLKLKKEIGQHVPILCRKVFLMPGEHEKPQPFPLNLLSFTELIHRDFGEKPLAGVHTGMFVKISTPRNFRGSSQVFLLGGFKVSFSSTCSHFRSYTHLQDFAGSNKRLETQ